MYSNTSAKILMTDRILIWIRDGKNFALVIEQT